MRAVCITAIAILLLAGCRPPPAFTGEIIITPPPTPPVTPRASPTGAATPTGTATATAAVSPTGQTVSPTAPPPTPATTESIAEVSPASPTAAPVAPSPTNTGVGGACVPAPPPGWRPYTVRPGDTVGRLAARCPGTTIAAIAAANCLDGAYTILSGQNLYLPAGCPTEIPQITIMVEPTDTIPPPGPPQPGADGEIVITPPEAAPGEYILLVFSNFSRNDLITARFLTLATNEVVGSVQAYANADGEARVGYFIPLTFPPGDISVEAEDTFQIGFGQLVVLEPATPTLSPTPSPTSSPTGTATPTATATPEPTTEPPRTEPQVTPSPVVLPEPTAAP